MRPAAIDDARVRGRAHRHVGRLTGITLLVAAMAGAPAAAQDAAPPADDGAPLEIEASTLYVSPTTDAIPPTLRRQFPPEAVCVVRPELCPEASEDVRQTVVGALREVNEREPAVPVQPVPADTAAVSFLGGQPRYQTAIRFALPPVPDGQEIVAFTVTVPQSQPSYELGSPAFRRAVLAAFETIGPQDPAVLAEGLAAALQEDPVELDPELIGIEACPLLSEFTPGGAPQASSDDDLPRRAEGDEEVVDVDCIYGTNAVRTDGDVWSFDLTFTAAAWADGELANHGLLLRPIGAPNLAFGDPDTSTTAQVALDLTEVRASMQTAEPAPPVEGMPPLEDGPADPVVAAEGDFGDDGFDDGFDDGGFDDDAGGGGDGGFDDVAFDDAGGEALADGESLDEAALADGAPGDAAEVAAPPGGANPTLAADEGGVGNPWWLWLLVPVFLGGAYLTSQALVPGGVSLPGSGGALSRLIERRGGDAGLA
ncbi:hypothetical protein [Egicoccus sp. AB-alg2]|uniref:hypothetical protein n=1 Tax=Egicoccus sp. AB-alg2 TaxID=3242693 RepID=UPI00359EEE0F